MRRVLVSTLLLIACVLMGLPAAQPQNPRGSRPPRLVVILVVDQMRSDYLEIHRRHWRAGFSRLLTEGAVFEHAEYPYMNTVTCAGHATIATGTFPRTHGMTLNDWYDRTRGTINCTDDGDSPVVSYAREAGGGASGRLLLVPTLADELRGQRPGTRVVTLSMKARSAIELAGHGGNAVTWVDVGAASFVTSRTFSATPVPAVAEFLKHDPYEADATKSWALRDGPGTYKYPDSSVGARPQTGRTGLFPHRVGSPTGPDARFFSLWQASPYSDAYLGRMAAALGDAFQLGQR